MSLSAAYQDRSRLTAIWLFSVAVLVLAMVVVGGVTRLTDSGLSITEWAPISGALPPLNEADWARAFDAYRRTTEYQQVNAGMTLQEFESIYWWEWVHRLLGRLIGVAFAVPFAILLIMRAIPRRLIWRCVVLLAMGGLQGLVGWWMVVSGLAGRVDVAPERLTTHLGLALLIFVGLVWTALEAEYGEDYSRSPAGWTRGALALLALVFFQCLLGGLVAGNDAGRVYTDWPLMEGSFFPPVDWGLGAMAFLHDQGLVQFMHRLGGYAVFLCAAVFLYRALRLRLSEGVPAAAIALMAAVFVQMLLGIATLMTALNPWLAGFHQAGGVIVLGLATYLLWRVRRSQPRLFMSSGIASRGL
ncbi:COX15/CtaA family protein [Brevundimonas sp.]|uniref:COX15/CtaA family protein n=1 Tax=Brevundimonas sp. TaxID=1871086 RepID=UPI0025E9D1A0|nr:COX15/CtaA family protein [Brevundimonas sp.]